ncbi:hypothetical protein OF83DRAFT_1073321 [Amylostereum chailletii]|nr:hypothetical protein OF83DRAFT_1073321 [Amylostereum chailletii]
MKTRRKSKVAAAAAAETEQDHDAASVQTEDAPGTSKHDLALAFPDDLDTEYLASLLPETNLSSPTPDTIISLYRLLISQDVDLDTTRRAMEEAQATLEKKDIELDQVLQDRESSSQEVEKELASVQQELTEVKREREELRAS